jgi:hypothetical protein
VHANDRAEIQVIVPRDQGVISDGSEAGALAKEKDDAVRVKNPLRFAK